MACFASFNSNHLRDFSFFKLQYACSICAPFSRFGVFLSTICAFIIHALQNAAQILFVTDGSFDYFLDTIGIIFREYCNSEVLLFLVPCIKMLFLLLIIIFIFLCCRIKLKSSAHTLCIFKISLNKYIIKWPWQAHLNI